MGLEEEIKELEKRFSEAPDSRLFLPLADALRSAGELQRAVKLCREGLERFPEFASARVLLGECLAELGELALAEETFELLRQEDRENVLVIRKMASLAERQGDPAKAETLYKEAAGFTAEAAVDIEASVAEQLAAPDGEPGEIFLTHTLADIYRLQGHYDRAQEIYRKLLDRDSENRELKKKLEEVEGFLRSGGKLEAVKISAAETEAGDYGAPPDKKIKRQTARSGSPDEPIEERIDAIFRFLLGDQSAPENFSPALGTLAGAPDDPEAYVDMLDHWITGLREAEAQ